MNEQARFRGSIRAVEGSRAVEGLDDISINVLRAAWDGHFGVGVGCFV